MVKFKLFIESIHLATGYVVSVMLSMLYKWDNLLSIGDKLLDDNIENR